MILADALVLEDGVIASEPVMRVRVSLMYFLVCVDEGLKSGECEQE